jgi:hypothetical protein
MDAILAERNLAKQKNNAQEAINQSIQRKANIPHDAEFAIPVMLIAGDINLSQLKVLNVNSVITKERSSITEVRGIPEGIKNVKFEKQLLVELPELPKSIVSLNLNHNYIEFVDLSPYTNLKVVYMNGNKLKRLNKNSLPSSLQELYVDDNELTSINLTNVPNLRVLHCKNNKMLSIEEIPASCVDLQVEEGNPKIVLDYAFLPNNSRSEDDFIMRGTEAEFVQSMHDYFDLKRKYELKENQIRIDAKESALKHGLGIKKAIKYARGVRPNCINCKRKVGTIFKEPENRLIAYCGDRKEPCELQIEIYKGKFNTNEISLKNTQYMLLAVKEEIIRQKMDVLFNYVSEEETVEKFKDLIDDYNMTALLYKTDIDIREDKHFNVNKREIIKTKTKLLEEIKKNMNMYIQEYMETGNRDLIHSAVDLYIREYMPEINNIRMMKYSVMEMVPIGFEEKTIRVRKLNQCAASLRELESFDEEVPRVIRFKTGKTQQLQSQIVEDLPISLED